MKAVKPSQVEGVTRLLEQSYDRIAPKYYRDKGPKSKWQVRELKRLMRLMPPGGRLLDMGCGIGPVLELFHRNGFRVTGIDQSGKMVAFSKRSVPQARVFHRNMFNPGFKAGSFDGIVSLFAIIHVPQGKQPAVFRHMGRLLSPGGHFLINIGSGAYEYVGPHCGEWMYWSGADLKETFRRIRRAGLEILRHEELGPRGDRQTWILGRKK
jgi:2-polyprenyl-3-methyl-5-hydroxy-6-metoxy-1,4-benzoquinol methylase